MYYRVLHISPSPFIYTHHNISGIYMETIFTTRTNLGIFEIERKLKMNNNKDEQWYPVKGYESMYEVSDQGRVKSVKFGKEKILKPGRNQQGYLLVNICKNGERKMYLVHRLVAQAFIPNTNNLPQVNHKDEDKENNKVENLEWCDSKYNINYGNRTQRQVYKLSKPVLQYTKSGGLVREWKSATDVERNLGYFHNYISKCCTGRYKSAYNFIWKFKD